MKKNRLIFLVNLVPYLILLITLISAYSGISNQKGTIIGSLSIIVFFLIFIFNIFHIPSLVASKMQVTSLAGSRTIGIAICLILNVVLFMAIFYTHAYIDYYIMR